MQMTLQCIALAFNTCVIRFAFLECAWFKIGNGKGKEKGNAKRMHINGMEIIIIFDSAWFKKNTLTSKVVVVVAAMLAGDG